MRLIDADALKERLKQPVMVDKEKADRIWEGWHECTVMVDAAIDDTPTIETERKTMSDPVDRQEVLDAIDVYILGKKETDICEVRELLKLTTKIYRMPAIKIGPKKGKWIDKGWHGDWQFETDGIGNCWKEFECSVCHGISKAKRAQFCPNCGADMRGDEKT